MTIKDIVIGSRAIAQAALRLGKGWNKLPEIEKQQISYRFQKADLCIKNGSCVKCGCKMPAKLFANDGCDIGCYPPLMSEDKWKLYDKLDNQKQANQYMITKIIKEINDVNASRVMMKKFLHDSIGYIIDNHFNGHISEDENIVEIEINNKLKKPYQLVI